MGSRRDDLIILTGASIRKGRTKKEILEALDGSLRRLQTDRIEIFKTHNIDDPEQLRIAELFEAFEEAKQAGKALHLGVSGHGRKLTQCLQAALDEGGYEVFLCRYDFMSYREEQARLFRAGAEAGVGSLVFKIKAGERQKEIRDLESDGLSFTQATVKWALSNPDVSSVCAGITNFDQIREYCGAVGRPLQEAEMRMLSRYAAVMHDRYCRNCGRCESACPHGVAVADIMRFAMYFKYYGREKDSLRLYASLAGEQRADACFNCDEYCRQACPFGRDIRAGLLEAHEMLTWRV
jgi:predicted aldo/keto reductase-like oxidoreductase